MRSRFAKQSATFWLEVGCVERDTLSLARSLACSHAHVAQGSERDDVSMRKMARKKTALLNANRCERKVGKIDRWMLPYTLAPAPSLPHNRGRACDRCVDRAAIVRSSKHRGGCFELHTATRFSFQPPHAILTAASLGRLEIAVATHASRSRTPANTQRGLAPSSRCHRDKGPRWDVDDKRFAYPKLMSPKCPPVLSLR